MIERVWNIFTSIDHWKAPFTLKVASQPGTQGRAHKLTRTNQITTIALSALVGLLTFGIGGIGFFFGYTAFLKDKRITILKLPPLVPIRSINQRSSNLTPTEHHQTSSRKSAEKAQRISGTTITTTETNKNVDTPHAPTPTPIPTPTPESLSTTKTETSDHSSSSLTFSFQNAIKKKLASIARVLTDTPKPPLVLDKNTPIPPPPASGIKIGLTNLGATCWLNSSLKFLASTNYYDGILGVDVEWLKDTGLIKPERAEPLQAAQTALRHAIIRLRQGTSLTQDEFDAEKNERENLYNTLVGALHNLWPENNIWTDQLDSIEFICDLQAAFRYPLDVLLDRQNATQEIRKRYPQTLQHYKCEVPGYLKNANLQNFDTQILVTLPLEEFEKPEPVNIPSLYKFGGSCEVQPDYTIGENITLKPYLTVQNQLFKKKKVLINAPETMVINFKRILGENLTVDNVFQGIKKEKCYRELALDANDTMTFIEYEPNKVGVDNKAIVTKAQEKNICTYQVEAAICHLGSATGGHYIAYERSADGTLICHNDGSAQVISPEEATAGFKSATVLRMKLLSKTPFIGKPSPVPLETPPS